MCFYDNLKVNILKEKNRSHLSYNENWFTVFFHEIMGHYIFPFERFNADGTAVSTQLLFSILKFNLKPSISSQFEWTISKCTFYVKLIQSK
jgi:hypothetical protein